MRASYLIPFFREPEPLSRSFLARITSYYSLNSVLWRSAPEGAELRHPYGGGFWL